MYTYIKMLVLYLTILINTVFLTFSDEKQIYLSVFRELLTSLW